MFWADRTSTAERDVEPIRGDGLERMREAVLHTEPIMIYDHSRLIGDMPELSDDIIPYHRATRFICPLEARTREAWRIATVFIWAYHFYPNWRDYNPPMGIRRLGYSWDAEDRD